MPSSKVMDWCEKVNSNFPKMQLLQLQEKA